MPTPKHIQYANQRRKDATLERSVEAARMYLSGFTMRKIAERLDCSLTTVYRSLEVARGLWRERAALAIAEHKAHELARIDQVEFEAWKAWRRSQKDEVTEEEGTTPKGPMSRTRRKGQAGDGQFLSIIQKCVDQRLKLLGLDTPESTTESMTGLLEVVISTREEAAKVLPYAQFEKVIENDS